MPSPTRTRLQVVNTSAVKVWAKVDAAIVTVDGWMVVMEVCPLVTEGGDLVGLKSPKELR